MTSVEILVALVIAVGVAGIIVPVLPGTVLVLAAILGWAWHTGGAAAWSVAAIATSFLVLGAVVKFTVPGKRLKEAGVPSRTLWAGAALAFVGFFVVPVVGLFAGFVLGVYLSEHQRVGGAAAWPSTKHALRAVGVSILIELAAACLAALTWTVGLLIT
ncbi:MAG: DUF456 domain-containing protein [Nocardioides sp.]|nr:DUF456 domain-containing protein [Nocardioides sp.]